MISDKFDIYIYIVFFFSLSLILSYIWQPSCESFTIVILVVKDAVDLHRRRSVSIYIYGG